MAWALTESSGGVVQYEACSPDVRQVGIDWDEIVTDENPEYVEDVIAAVKVLPPSHRKRILTGIREYWKINRHGEVTRR